MRQRDRLFGVVDGVDRSAPVSDGADHLGMISLPHQNHRQTAGAVTRHHIMQAGDKRTSEINHLVRHAAKGFGDFRSHAMATDKHHFAARLFHFVDDRYAHGVQPPDDLRVVGQLAEGNDGLSFLRSLDRPIHRTFDSHAEARVACHRNRHKTVLLSIS